MTGAKAAGKGATEKEAAAERLVTFTPSVGFTGYPANVKTKFTVGKESVPVPTEFLEMVRAKGFVQEEDPPEKEG
ncbi:UNVERIFIED_ORG: hypothetical protein LHK14_18025 [Roseateles sp. XES5]|nr:hypothetical protein [Roseateles sp. XES5]